MYLIDKDRPIQTQFILTNIGPPITTHSQTPEEHTITESSMLPEQVNKLAFQPLNYHVSAKEPSPLISDVLLQMMITKTDVLKSKKILSAFAPTGLLMAWKENSWAF